jgi:hypothetical protein
MKNVLTAFGFLVLSATFWSMPGYAGVSMYCESGDPSGAGAQAYVDLIEIGAIPGAQISWTSARHKESKFTLRRTSVRQEMDPVIGPARVSTYIVSGGIRFELVESRDIPNAPTLNLITFNRVTSLACQKY